MPHVTVEVADLAGAARDLSGRVADPLFDRVCRALQTLQTVAGMAGDDPPARAWAADYDRAAPVAITAVQDVINACYRVSTMLAGTARNYAAAEAASTLPGRPVDPTVTAALATLPDDTRVGLPTDVPSACSDPGNPDLPLGWHYVAHHMGGYVWPNGHQDRLHRAAAAWRASADALDGYAFHATIVDVRPLVDGLPEGPDIATVCMALGDHAESLRARIPSDWEAQPSAGGDGTVFRDPAHYGRQIRIMPGYRAGNRSDVLTHGPYAVVSQNGQRAVNIPPAGNPVL